MSKICFVSFEIHPTVKGGAGVLLYNSALLLLRTGHEVIFLFDMTPEQFLQFDQVDRLNLPEADHCRAYRVQALTEQAPFTPKDFRSVFEFRSYRFHLAASQIYKQEKPDIIEFFEYTGPAYSALCCKVAGLDYQDTRLAVRMHGSLELIDREQPGALHGLDRYLMYNLEHHALRLAETVFSPSRSFLDRAVRPFYEDWFGETIVSQPPMLDYPRPIADAKTVKTGKDRPDAVTVANVEQDIILFFGRLQGIKGVDVFIDAAVLYLSDPGNLPRLFYLVGYDSYLPPGQVGSYQAYLEHKIPEPYRAQFQFTGQLSWQALGELLPRVAFAVIPSYYESFCYAAHELYQAGIPLILADLPAYAEFFQHERNVLIFDGTVSDLAYQMQRLIADTVMRQALSRPYPVLQRWNSPPLPMLNRTQGQRDSSDNEDTEHLDSTEHIYTSSARQSWIADSRERLDGEGHRLLVCVICDHNENLDQTLNSLPRESKYCRIVLVKPAFETDFQTIQTTGTVQITEFGSIHHRVQAWFLGKSYCFFDSVGKPLYPTQIRTYQAILILQAGDRLDPDYLPTALSTLQRQPQISFVGCWKRYGADRVDTLPLDTAAEIAPFTSELLFSRCVIRTLEGRLLLDLFDPRAGRYGELAYLWQGDTQTECGVMIPQAWVTCTSFSEKPDLESNALDYLLLREDQPRRKRRLARFLLSLDRRSQVLTRQRIAEYPLDDYGYWNAPWVKQLVGTRLNRSLNRVPWLKKSVRTVVKMLYAVLPGRGRST